jgi:hypothetical protein
MTVCRWRPETFTAPTASEGCARGSTSGGEGRCDGWPPGPARQLHYLFRSKKSHWRTVRLRQASVTLAAIPSIVRKSGNSAGTAGGVRRKRVESGILYAAAIFSNFVRLGLAAPVSKDASSSTDMLSRSAASSRDRPAIFPCPGQYTAAYWDFGHADETRYISRFPTIPSSAFAVRAASSIPNATRIVAIDALVAPQILKPRRG